MQQQQQEEFFPAAQADLLRRTLGASLSASHFEHFVHVARRLRLDPLARQIIALERTDSYGRPSLSIQVTIDGARLVAERHGQYAGQLGPYWCGPDGVWKDAWLDAAPPAAAKVAVLRRDFAEPLWAVGRFSSYAQTTSSGQLARPWRVMPDIMLAKCAEALALRKAFPAELAGIYTPDEMGQADMGQADLREPTPSPAPVTAAQLAQLRELAGALALDDAGKVALVREVTSGGMATLDAAGAELVIRAMQARVVICAGAARTPVAQ
jgi:phage recombination protein Bet